MPTLASQDVSYDLCDPLYWTSIEGNLIIIAACIPLLQPFLDKVRGRTLRRPSNKSSSNKNTGPYANFSKQSDPLELQSQPKKKVDTYGFTIHDKEDSEENIVDPRDKQSTTASSGRHSPGMGDGIVRTDSVTVAYDHGENGATSAATRWAAV